MDLPDPEDVLADPAGAVLPERGDLRQAVLDGVVAAVRARPDRARWDSAWAVLVRALETGAPDLVVVPATTLASLRQQDWDVAGHDREARRDGGAVAAGGPGGGRLQGPHDERGDPRGDEHRHVRRGRPSGPRQAVRRPSARRPGPPVSRHGAVRPAHRRVEAGADDGRRPALAVLCLPGVRGPDAGGGAGGGVGARGVPSAARPPRARRPGGPGARADRSRGPAADEHRRGLRDQRRRVRRGTGRARGRRPARAVAAARGAADGGVPERDQPRTAHP